jgi:short-subunit dehydrogenase
VTEVALVTGASSGIGTEFARALSGRGHELVLVARRRERLEQIASELPGEAHVLECDLTRDADELPGRVRELGLEVHLLVNNAGFGSWGPFVEKDSERLVDQVRLNCEAVVALTRAFLPPMLERRRGGVITVASTAGMQPLPYEAVYSATKAFARTFSDALHAELRGTGVRVLAVNPGPVPTEFQDTAGHEPSVPGRIEARQVVEESLRAFEAGRRTIIPGRVIRWYLRASAALPAPLKLRIAERMYRPRRG